MIVFLFLFLIAAVKQTALLNYDQVILNITPGNSGAATIKKLFFFINKIVSTISFSPELIVHGDDIRKGLFRFDLDPLVENSLAVKAADGFTTVAFQGTNRKTDYHIALKKDLLPEPALSRLGDFHFKWQLRKNDRTILPDKKSITLKIENSVNTEGLSHKAMARHINGMLMAVDPQNLNHMPPGQCHYFSYLKDDSAKVLSQLYKSFPRIIAFSEKYFILRPFIEQKTCDGTPYTVIHHNIMVDIDKLELDFPDFSEFVEDMLTEIEVRMVLTDAKGRRLFSLKIGDKHEPAFGFEAATKDGRIVPVSPSGKPFFEESISFIELEDYHCFVEVENSVRWAGLTITGNMTSRIDYASNEKEAEFINSICGLPEINIKGWLFYFIPIFNINLNSADLAPGFAKVLMSGNDGKGIIFSLKSNAPGPYESRLNMKGSAEILDTFFLSFMIHMVSDKMPEADEKTDFAKFVMNVSSLLYQDIEDIEKRYALLK